MYIYIAYNYPLDIVGCSPSSTVSTVISEHYVPGHAEHRVAATTRVRYKKKNSFVIANFVFMARHKCRPYARMPRRRFCASDFAATLLRFCCLDFWLDRWDRDFASSRFDDDDDDDSFES